MTASNLNGTGASFAITPIAGFHNLDLRKVSRATLKTASAANTPVTSPGGGTVSIEYPFYTLTTSGDNAGDDVIVLPIPATHLLDYLAYRVTFHLATLTNPSDTVTITQEGSGVFPQVTGTGKALASTASVVLSAVGQAVSFVWQANKWVIDYDYTSGQFGTQPTLLTAPTVTGVALTTNVLTGGNGTWTNTPTSYTCRWLRDGSSSQGTSGTYTVAAGDVGHFLVFEVTAINAIGSSVATSAPVYITA